MSTIKNVKILKKKKIRVGPGDPKQHILGSKIKLGPLELGKSVTQTN